MDTFSRENIENLVSVPSHSGIAHFIRNIAGPVLDWSGLLGIIVLSLGTLIIPAISIVLLPAVIFLAVYQLVLIYFSQIRFYKIKVNSSKIELGLPKPVSFVFVSDIHVGSEYAATNNKRLQKIVDKINALNPELVLFGGDFFTERIEVERLQLLNGVKAPLQFGVYGNHDAYYLKNNVSYTLPTKFLEAIKTTKIKLLINESVNLQVNGVDLCIAGIPDLYSKNFDIKKAFADASPGTKRILLSHNPDVIDFIKEEDNIDLLLSGHNHSGQIFLPVIGAALPMPTKRRWLTKGLFQITKNTKLFLSQGVGYSGSRLRINTDAEICDITLT